MFVTPYNQISAHILMLGPQNKKLSICGSPHLIMRMYAPQQEPLCMLLLERILKVLDHAEYSKLSMTSCQWHE